MMAQLRVILFQALAGQKIPMASVLDIGAGTFFYRELLESRFERVGRPHCSLSMLGSGAESPSANPESRTELCCGEVEHLPFPDDSFSCVFGMDVIHHLEDPVPVFNEVFRVLAPGGIYLGIEPNMKNPGMLLAHLLPAEERGALKINWPGRWRSLLAGRFTNVKRLLSTTSALPRGLPARQTCFSRSELRAAGVVAADGDHGDQGAMIIYLVNPGLVAYRGDPVREHPFHPGGTALRGGLRGRGRPRSQSD